MAEPDARAGCRSGVRPDVPCQRDLVEHRIGWADPMALGRRTCHRRADPVSDVADLLVRRDAEPRAWSTPACSGADVAALAAAITLSYPVAWRRRIAACHGLRRSSSSTRSASRLSTPSPHRRTRYPAPPLRVAGRACRGAVAYVWLWIRWSETRDVGSRQGWPRFFKLSLGGLTAYAAAAPWVFTSAVLGTVGVWTASAAESTLASLGGPREHDGQRAHHTARRIPGHAGMSVHADDSAVARGCFSWPLQRSRARRMGGARRAAVLRARIARLLVLALPPSIAERPMFLAHGFYQILAGCAAIVVAAHVAFRGESARAVSPRAHGARGAISAACRRSGVARQATRTCRRSCSG